MRLALIDLGTNSVRFDVYDLEAGKKPLRLHREKLMVRLGENLFVDGLVDETAAQRTLEAFVSFQDTATSLDVQKIVAVATSALRHAKDGDRFAQQLAKKSGIPLTIISGEEEARLIAEGILEHETVPDGLFGLIDIGGGSTEISICKDQDILSLASLELGAARIQQVFLKSVPPRASGVNAARQHIRKVISESAIGSAEGKLKHFIGSSGTLRALAKILPTERNDCFSTKDLRELVEKMTPMSSDEILAIPGMEANRVDLILAGSLVLLETLLYFGTSSVGISEHSLRDGLLVRELNAMAEKKSSELAECPRETLAKRLSPLGMQSKEISWLFSCCEVFFGSTRSYHSLADNWCSAIGGALAFLQLGRKLGPADQPRHAHYLVMNSDLPAVSRSERERIARLCLLLEKKKIKDRDLENFSKSEAAEFLGALALLRIIHALVDVRPALTKYPNVEGKKETVKISLREKTLFYLRHLRLEERKGLFETLFNVRIFLDQTVPVRAQRSLTLAARAQALG